MIAFQLNWMSPNGSFEITVPYRVNPAQTNFGWSDANALEAQQTLEYCIGWQADLRYVTISGKP